MVPMNNHRYTRADLYPVYAGLKTLRDREKAGPKMAPPLNLSETITEPEASSWCQRNCSLLQRKSRCPKTSQLHQSL